MACASTGPRVGPKIGNVVEFTGACDASGGVPLDASTFAVADDEDNVIRIYDADRGGAPISSIDLSLWLREGDEEADLEAATRIGDRALWLASHSRSKKGKFRPSRILFLATEIPKPGASAAVVGEPYRGLLDALHADPRYSAFGLDEAAKLPPKAPGGLNIEGLTSTGNGGVLVGLRNPTPGDRALLFVIGNALDVAEGRAHPKLGDPILLELGGRGVRGLTRWRGAYLIAAGAREAGPSDALFEWPGPGAEPRELGLNLAGFNPEGFFSSPARAELMLLSDDGELEIEGRACKRLEVQAQRRFRGVWIH